MTWFKVDDSLPTHRKVLSLPRGPRRLSAVGAWTLGGAWSSANLTEGFIPQSVLGDLSIAPKVAADLVDCGLWRTEPGGYRMHDFLDYNPSSERVQQDRADAAERQRRAREKAKAARDALAASASSHAVTHNVTTSVSHGPPDPTRPDPVLALPDESSEVEVHNARAAIERAVESWGLDLPDEWQTA